MSRLRKIYKGEEGWDSIFTNQDEILNANGKSKINQADVNAVNPGMNKIFREDASAKNLSDIKAPYTNITTKLNNVAISNKNNLNNVDDYNVEEIQDLVFQNIEVDNQDNQANFEVNEEDYMNFDVIHNEDDHKSLSKDGSNVYKNEKRNFIQAFGDKSIDANIEDENLSNKKIKFN